MINKVIQAVRDASELMKEDSFEIQQKGNNSNYVTAVDVKVQEFLYERLSDLLPGSNFIGEEKKENSISEGYNWIVDPIDGTSNFIRDIGFSGISVGLYHGNKPCLGVVYQPYRDEMFYAEIGKGAFLNGKPIHASSRDFAHSHLCSAMSLYDKRYATACFHIIEKIYHQSDDLRRMGSAALELVYLAAGRVELYFEIRVFPWDVAGAIPILMESGARFECMFADKFPMDRPFPIIAANNDSNLAQLKEIVYGELSECPY